MHLPLSSVFPHLVCIISLLALKFFVQVHGQYQNNPRVYFAFSPPKLISLANLDRQIYSILLNANTSGKMYDNKKLSHGIKMYKEDHELSVLHHASEAATKENFSDSNLALEVSHNPMKAYRLIKRCAFFAKTVLPIVRNELPLRCEWCKTLKNLLRGVTLPTVDDEDDAMSCILRIQLYHDYSAEDMSQGIFGKIDTGARLSEFDMVNIGMYAGFVRSYVHAIEWLELGLQTLHKKVMEKSVVDSIDVIDDDVKFYHEVKQTLRRVKLEHDESWEQLKYSRDTRDKINLFVNKVLESNDDPATPRTKVADLHRQMYESYKDEQRDPVPLRFRNLCAGKNYQTVEEQRVLYCWYERKVHPYWYINPLKVELLHAVPKLIQVYDFVGDQFLNEIKEVSEPTLAAAGTVNLATLKEEVNSYRVSVHSWIKDRSLFYIKDFYRKVELFTGLKTLKAAEDLQVAGYTFGGHYEQHYDCLFDKSLIQIDGERMATFMLYMNDVKAGGYTAFPELGTAALPVKGSAVFWYDTLKNGTCDLRLIHGACPVVLDHKFVANLWIHSNENFLNMKCGMDSST